MFPRFEDLGVICQYYPCYYYIQKHSFSTPEYRKILTLLIYLSIPQNRIEDGRATEALVPSLAGGINIDCIVIQAQQV